MGLGLVEARRVRSWEGVLWGAGTSPIAQISIALGVTPVTQQGQRHAVGWRYDLFDTSSPFFA